MSFQVEMLFALLVPIFLLWRTRPSRVKSPEALDLPGDLLGGEASPRLIESHARARLAQGGKGEAIRLLRAATGLGPEDARACVELL